MEESKMRKHNMKLYPIYRMLSYDYLFYYTINVLFLTQIKHISPSGVMLIDVFYSVFGVVFQIPASFILEKIGRKKSLILGNLVCSIYLLIVIFSQNLIQLILAETMSAFGFALKDVASPSLLNESIPVTKRKSDIFGKINGKAMSGYYILNAISLIISGFLYSINGYFPMFLSLGVVVITFLLSNTFYESFDEENEKEETSETVGLKESLKFIFSSGRIKSLILYSSIMISLIYILNSCEVYLLEELEVSSGFIGTAFAILGIFSGLASKKQDKFQSIFKNKTLTAMGITISLTCITSTIGFLLELPAILTIAIILISYAFKYIVCGLYQVLIIKYLSNFTNKEIDSKIFTAQMFFNSVCSAILGVLASMYLEKFNIVTSMITFGIASLILFIIVIIYMESKLGLDPKKYSKEEIKYDKLAD